MPGLLLSLFGPFSATVDGQEVSGFRTRFVQALLIYLTCQPERHSREHLMALLWPDLAQTSAQQNLRQNLYYLRKSIPDVMARDGRHRVPLLRAGHHTLQINPDAAVELDIRRFSVLLDPKQPTSEQLSEAVALYRGDFLADFYLPGSNPFEEWAAVRREAYRRQVLSALERLTAIHLADADTMTAESYARRQLAIDTLHEAANRQLIEILARSGRRRAALAHYDDYRRLLRTELGVEPGSETLALLKAVEAGELQPTSQRPGHIRSYELREELGHGSFGVVHRAFQPAIGRDVAIKVIPAQYADEPGFIRRFETEAQTIARLEHPQIVPLYDYWREPGNAYLVMRYLRGGNLKAALEQGTWPLAKTVQLVEQVAAALHTAHRNGVVHRDVKPANILLDEADNAYLSDFGIAKLFQLEEAIGPIETITGTPEYLSPEQINNDPATPLSDQYSLGVVVYELLIGQPPFMADSLLALLEKHVHESLPLVSQQRPEVPVAVDEALRRATAKRPEARFPNVVAFAYAFAEAFHTDALQTRQANARLDVVNPYMGLLSFTEADAELFFGREGAIKQLLARLTLSPTLPLAGGWSNTATTSISLSLEGAGSAATTPTLLLEGGEKVNVAAPLSLPLEGGGIKGEGRFLAVVGPSGSGKSSLVKAGLVPALRQGAVPGSERWFILDVIPGAHPFEEIETALLRIAVNPPASLLEQLTADESGLLHAVQRVLPAADDSQLLLIIDQFEELFTLVPDRAVTACFLDSLYTAVTDPHSPLRVIITLRADFYDRPLLYPGISELLQHHTEVVVPLTPDELVQAIERPAALVGVQVEPELVAAFVADLNERPGALPLLQHALSELFERREGNCLTLGTYRQLDGISGALSQRAETVYAQLDEAGQTAARDLFLRLVTLGEGVEDTRRRVLRAELMALDIAGERGRRVASGEWRAMGTSLVSTESPNFSVSQSLVSSLQSSVSNVIDLYGRARLLSFDRDPVTRGPTVEIAHEALLRAWPRLRGWMDESRAELRLGRLLTQAAAEWEAAGREEGFLLRGARLDQLAPLATGTIALTGSERHYLDTSLAARHARQAAEEARRQEEITTVHRLAETERQRAAEQGHAARRLRQRAALLAGALVLASILALAALLFGRQAQQNAVLADNERTVALAAEATAAAEADVRATAEADARQQQAAAENQTRLATSRELTQAALNLLEIDPELSILLTLQALATAETKEAQEALHHSIQASRIRLTFDNITGIVDTPEGPLPVTVGEEAIMLWNPETEDPLYTLPFTAGDPEASYELFASQDGDNLLLFSWPANREPVTVQTWKLEEGELAISRTLPIRLDAHSDVTFSPNGQWLAIGYENGTAELWDTQTGQRLLTIASHEDWVWYVAFDENGRRLATVGPDGQIFIWDVPASIAAGSGRQLASLMIPPENGQPFAFTFVNDTRVAVGTHLGWVQLWDLNNSDSPFSSHQEHNDFVQHLPLNADRSQLASVANDGSAKIWDVASGDPLLTLAGSAASFRRAYFNRDGTHLMTFGDGVAWDWDVRLHALGEMGSFTTAPLTLDLKLSPSGEQMAAGSEIISPSLWEPVTGKSLQMLTGSEEGVFRVAYSPDGSRLAGVGRDNQVRIWDLSSGEVVLTMAGHGPGEVAEGLFSGIMDVAFSPDGARLATAGADGVAKVWDAETGEELLAFTNHTDGLSNVLYSPDGRWIATSSYREDATVRVWDAETGDERFVLRGHTGDVWGLAMSPDGSRLVSGSDGGLLKVWDMSTGAELYSLPGLTDVTLDIVFTPDGQFFITAEQALRVWRTEGGEEILTIYARPVNFLAISPDGRRLYAVDIQDTVQVFTVQLEDTIALAHERLTRWWQPEECQRYLHTAECPPAPPKFSSDE
jgi:WD40 repeat protein/serine/threonine protein kinase